MYNRYTIPRLGLDSIQKDEVDEYREKQEDQRRKQVLNVLREKLRYGKERQKAKRQKVSDNREKDNEVDREREQIQLKPKSKTEEKIKKVIKKKRLKGSLELEDKDK